MSETLQNQFRALFENNYPGAEELRQKLIAPLWKDTESSNLTIAVDTQDKDKIKGITIFASQSSDINFVDVELADSIVLKNNRVAINRYITKYIIDAYQSALIFFHYKDTVKEWRISYVYKRKGNKDTTSAKRYTYLCGKKMHCRTAAERFAGLVKEGGYPDNDAMITAFSVESLTKEFFNQLFKWYDTWACKVTRFPSKNCIAAHGELTTENNKIHLIRLITRIMFVWFIKQKNLVPSWIFDRAALHTLLADCDFDSEEKGNYYNAILQNLFFGALNKKIEARSFADKSFNGIPNEQYGIKSYFRDDNTTSFFTLSHDEVTKYFESVPFLNGGLFECLDYDVPHGKNSHKVHYVDGFSRNADRRAFIPNALFWSEDEEKLGLIPLFNRYNFTVEESTATDVQVALDPELLGKIFENLLGTYNPETKESARKESGSFYTPREIVSYMVNLSISTYLQKELPDIGETTIESLVNGENIPSLSAFKINEIRNALSAIKIIDPACGSGAFPMGILNKLVELYTSLDRLSGMMDTDDEGYLYKLKKQIIEDSIFGVDIQPIAVQICKLRFFISLICEQPKTGTIENNYGYNPLPNLETKFVAANTLIGLQEDEKNLLDYTDKTITKYKNDLIEVRKNHFAANNVTDKMKNRRLDENLRKEIISYLQKNASKVDEQKNAQLKEKEAVLKQNLESLSVDLVSMGGESANLFGEIEDNSLFYDRNEEKRKALKTELKIIQKEIAFEKSKVKSSETAVSLEELVKWNPYDQNATSPFFDSDWMFGVKDGFDIVIGNPPYVQLQKDDGKLAKLYGDKGYETYAKMGDIYCLFYEKGYSLLNEKGRLCFITSNKWMRAGYGEKLREFFASKVNPKLLVDFAGVKVFESATVDTNILLFEKGKNKGKTQSCATTTLTKDGLSNLSDFVRQESYLCKFTSNESWVILSPIEQSIKRKIESVGVPLKDWDISINYGIKTGFNDAFIISGAKRDEILANCKTDDERKRTAELIRPILRGRDIKRYSYEYADLYLIATFPAKHYDIEKYPAVKDYLLSFGMERLEQTGKEHTINGEKIKARKKTNNKWFETQDSISYWDEFNKPKIVWGNLNLSATYTLAPAGMMINAPATMIVPASESLLCILNSKLADYYIRNLGVTRNGGYFEYKPMFIEQLPVPQNIDEKLFKDFTEKELDNEEKIDRKVYELYGLNTEEISFIEKVAKPF